MAHQHPDEYSCLNLNGGHPYDWDKQIKHNKGQLVNDRKSVSMNENNDAIDSDSDY